jgi:hypothetical protein
MMSGKAGRGWNDLGEGASEGTGRQEGGPTAVQAVAARMARPSLDPLRPDDGSLTGSGATDNRLWRGRDGWAGRRATWWFSAS